MTWTPAMPPLVAQAFWPLMHPFVLGLVVLGGRADRRYVGAGVGLGGAERCDRDLVLGAEALRDPLGDLLGRALAEDAATASEVPMIDMPIPASPQKSSSLAIGS